MKQLLSALIVCVFSIVLYSCADQTYANQLKAEQNLINEYISRNNIEVLSEFPDEGTVWGENQYVKLSNGMYYHLEKAGDTNDTIKYGDLAVIRFKMYTLNEHPDSTINWTTADFPYGPEFIYDGTTTTACTAWVTAVAYMENQDAECKIIVPSKIGFTSTHSVAIANWGVLDDDQSVTPRLYHLRLTINNQK